MERFRSKPFRLPDIFFLGVFVATLCYHGLTALLLETPTGSGGYPPLFSAPLFSLKKCTFLGTSYDFLGKPSKKMHFFCVPRRLFSPRIDPPGLQNRPVSPPDSAFCHLFSRSWTLFRRQIFPSEHEISLFYQFFVHMAIFLIKPHKTGGSLEIALFLLFLAIFSSAGRFSFPVLRAALTILFCSYPTYVPRIEASFPN